MLTLAVVNKTGCSFGINRGRCRWLLLLLVLKVAVGSCCCLWLLLVVAVVVSVEG